MEGGGARGAIAVEEGVFLAGDEVGREGWGDGGWRGVDGRVEGWGGVVGVDIDISGEVGRQRKWRRGKDGTHWARAVDPRWGYEWVGDERKQQQGSSKVRRD